MHTLRLLTLTAVFLFTNIGCAESPLMNHKEGSDPETPAPSADTKDCQLRFEKANLCLKVTWLLGPRATGESQFVAELTADPTKPEEAQEISGYTLKATLWMPEHGHGSSPVTVEQIEPSKFLIKNVYFIMPGKWDVIFNLTEQDVVVDTTALSLVL